MTSCYFFPGEIFFFFYLFDWDSSSSIIWHHPVYEFLSFIAPQPVATAPILFLFIFAARTLHVCIPTYLFLKLCRARRLYHKTCPLVMYFMIFVSDKKKIGNGKIIGYFGRIWTCEKCQKPQNFSTQDSSIW